MKKILLLAVIGIFGNISLKAQEGLPFYSHYLVSDKYLINPSYAPAAWPAFRPVPPASVRGRFRAASDGWCGRSY